MKSEMNNTSEIKYLDGKRFLISVLAGANEIFSQKDYLDKINYFPVPDGDTGTNISGTFQGIVERIESWNLEKIGDSVSEVANIALETARGNSGVIFAQYFHAIAKELKNEFKISTDKFGLAVKNAVGHVYNAISNPQEGTILTVMREWANFVCEESARIKDFPTLICSSLEVARKSLQSTKYKIEVLKKNSVVDSGALGFVLFIEGIVKFLKNGRISDLKKMRKRQVVIDFKSSEDIDIDSLSFRWCTECIIKGDNINPDLIKNKISEFGDSIVVAGSGNKVRVHIHTDDPAGVMYILKDFGEIIYQKADDMYIQYRIAHSPHPDIAIVTDSASDLPQEIIEKYMINLVPIRISFGNTTYLDKITITPDIFYKMLDTAKEYPVTSQPTPNDFINLFRFLLTHYKSIIGIFLADKLSGTYQNALKASKYYPNDKITIIDSGFATAGEGHLVKEASEATYAGKKHDEIVEEVERWKLKTRFFVYVDTFKYLMRSGRVDPIRGILAKVLNVKPILLLDGDGSVKHIDKAFSRKKGLNKLIRHTVDLVGNKTVKDVSIIQADCMKMAEFVRDRIRQQLKIREIPILPASPVVGAHAGRGTVGVAVTWE